MLKTPNIYHQVGHKIMLLRQQQGISQEQLAFAAGIHRTYIGSIEKGRKRVSLEKLERIAQALGVEVADLFTPAV